MTNPTPTPTSTLNPSPNPNPNFNPNPNPNTTWNPDWSQEGTAGAANWRNYMCAKVTGTYDDEGSKHHREWKNVKLGSTYYQPARYYDFASRIYEGLHNADYGRIMRKGCAKYGKGWKRVCVDSTCRGDPSSIHLGQSDNKIIPAESTWKTHDYDFSDWGYPSWPYGIDKYINEFTDKDMCYYRGSHWKTAWCGRQLLEGKPLSSKFFMCAKAGKTWDDNKSVVELTRTGIKLGHKGGVKAETYNSN